MWRTALWGAAALFIGCATAPLPTRELASASTAVGAASGARAQDVPGADEDLRRAKDELAHAQALIDAGDNVSARGLLIRARADADLAAERAHESHLRAQAAEIARQAEALRAQIRF